MTPRDGHMNDVWDDVREVEDIERGFVRDDRLWAEPELSRYELLVGRRREVPQSIDPPGNATQQPSPGMVAEEGPAVAGAPSLSGGEVACLLGGKSLECRVVRLHGRIVSHSSNDT